MASAFGHRDPRRCDVRVTTPLELAVALLQPAAAPERALPAPRDDELLAGPTSAHYASSMPFIRVTTSRVPHVVTRDAVLAELSKQASKLFGKPERWVMTCLDGVAAMTFGGSSAPAAYVEVKNIGPLDAALARRVSAVVTAEVAKLGIERDRIYVEMTAADGERWGHAGATFG